MDLELTAEAYDRLQFGIDFQRRGTFRAALAEAVEALVAAYVPPEGSLDAGPRSIYATTIVEEWLRAHGFPEATQRRWVRVAGHPQWPGVEELCEIDCGTEASLLVQLPIISDGTRQLLDHAIVTS